MEPACGTRLLRQRQRAAVGGAAVVGEAAMVGGRQREGNDTVGVGSCHVCEQKDDGALFLCIRCHVEVHPKCYYGSVDNLDDEQTVWLKEAQKEWMCHNCENDEGYESNLSRTSSEPGGFRVSKRVASLCIYFTCAHAVHAENMNEGASELANEGKLG